MENISSCDDDHDQIGILVIPEDVLIQILVLLPVLSLLRFKSVCKSWRALIQSSLFIHLHLNTTTTNNNNNNKFGTFIFQTSDYYQDLFSNEEKKTEVFMLSATGGGGGDDNDDNEFGKLLKLEDLWLPPRYKIYPDTYCDDVFMVGSCNGLICIHDTDGKEVCLWNPATRQFRILPESLTLAAAARVVVPSDMEQDFVAFGYDVKTNDYKVVQISCFRPSTSDSRWWSVKEYIFQVQVYSSSTDSWRLLEGINSLPAFPEQHGGSLNHGVYLNGCYYFPGRYYIESDTQITRGNMILSFDFTKEIFTTIKHPHDYHLEMSLTCFGEKLAIFINMKVEEEEDEFYDIWVLNENGVKEEEEESWTKLHSTVPYSFGSGIPGAISNSGEFALLATLGNT